MKAVPSDAKVRRTRPLPLLLVVAAAGLAAAAVVTGHPSQPPQTAGVAPAGLLRGLDGEVVPLAALRGKVAVLNFWAPWCPACRAELPELTRFAAAHTGDCVALLGLSDDEPADLKAFADGHPLGYPVLRPDAALEKALGIEVLPTTVILDREGRVAKRVEGRVDRAQLEEWITPLRAGEPRC